MTYNVFKELAELDHLIKTSAHMGPPKYNITKMRIIEYLAKNKEIQICQKDIEEVVHLKKASITGAIDALENDGVIERVRDAKDGRKRYLVLTQKSRKHHEEIEKAFMKIEKRVVKGIDEKELDVFLKVLNEMKRNLTMGGFNEDDI